MLNMPLYSIQITTTREVVVSARTADGALKHAKAYAHDVMPSVNGHTCDGPIVRPPGYQSRTNDNAHEIPRHD